MCFWPQFVCRSYLWSLIRPFYWKRVRFLQCLVINNCKSYTLFHPFFRDSLPSRLLRISRTTTSALIAYWCSHHSQCPALTFIIVLSLCPLLCRLITVCGWVCKNHKFRLQTPLPKILAPNSINSQLIVPSVDFWHLQHDSFIQLVVINRVDRCEKNLLHKRIRKLPVFSGFVFLCDLLFLCLFLDKSMLVRVCDLSPDVDSGL